MILACPACGTRFAVAPDSLGPSGRRVKCGRCAHVWHALPPQAEAPPGTPAPDAAPIDAEPAIRAPAAEEDGPATVAEAMPVDAPPPVAPGLPQVIAGDGASAPEPVRTGAGGAGWAVLAAAVIAILAAAWFLRAEIVAAWPPAARLYAALGLLPPVPGEGLAIEVAPPRQPAGGDSGLEIEGTVANRTGRGRPVPTLRAIARDAEGKPLADWTFAAASNWLDPGESTTFRTRLDPTVEGAAKVEVTVAPAGGDARGLR